MSYLFHILFALATLSAAELDWVAPGHHGWFLPVLLAVPYVLAWVARRALLAGRFRPGALLERLLGVSPVLLQALAILRLGWLASLEDLGIEGQELEGWPGFELLAALLPYLVCQVAAIDARARQLVFAPQQSAAQRSFQLRMFASALLPFVVYLGLSSLIARSEFWRVCLEEVALLGAAAGLLALVVLLYGMPFFLRFAWDTSPIPAGWARKMLEEVARSAGFRYRELLVWHTGQQMSNAAIVGLSQRARHVFFSDLLLRQLGPRELAAVFAHEMGHARRAHALVFGALALGFFLGAQQVLAELEIESVLWNALTLAGVLALWYLAFGYLSRRFELEADLESLRVVGDSDALVRALELVTGAHAHERSSWRHFSTRHRVAFLHSAERDPLVGIRLRLKLGRWRILGFVLCALALLSETRGLAGSWNEDWLMADLRLGRFAEAGVRAEGRGVDPELATLGRRAAHLGHATASPEVLLQEAFAAGRSGDFVAAREWVRLAELRGMQGLGTLLEILANPAPSTETLLRAWRALPGHSGP